MIAPLFLALFPLAQGLAEDPVAPSARLLPAEVSAGANAEVRVTLKVDPGWHVYHPDMDPEAGGVPVSIKVSGDLEAAGKLRTLQEPELHEKDFGGGNIIEELWLLGSPEFSLPVKVKADPGQGKATVTVKYLPCTPRTCLIPTTKTVDLTFDVTAKPQESGLNNGLNLPNFGDALPGAEEEYKVRWKFEVEPKEVRSGEKIELRITAEVEDGWHLYHPVMGYEAFAPAIKSFGGAFVSSGKQVLSTEAEGVVPEVKLGDNDRWLEHTIEFVGTTVVSGDPGAATGEFELRWQTCNDRLCNLPVEKTYSVPVTILAGGTMVARSATEADGDVEITSAAQLAIDGGMWRFILAAVVAGLFTLGTPCVFPMIPITVSFFTKRAESGKGTPLGNAAAYAFGLIFTFVGVGLLVTALMGAGGLNTLASNPILNLLIGAMFVVFAFSLFGFFEIQAPQWMQNRMNKVTADGQSKSGYMPVLAMAAAFSVISFTCTVGFVGGLLVVAAGSGNWLYPLVGMTAFAITFATPFFFLALFPSLLNKLPKSGGWMDALKVSFGFIEIVVAWKFFSNADLFWDLEILKRPTLAILMALPLFLWAAYLFGLFKMPHEFEKAKPGKARMLLGIAVVVFGAYIAIGVDRDRIYPQAIEALLPPKNYGYNLGPADLEWIESYSEAVEAAKSEGKPLFIDFTGVTCLNCRAMEGGIMPNEKVKPLLEEFVRAELWVDKPPHGPENKKLQIERFKTSQQPQYLILDPNSDRLLAEFMGYDPDPEAFAAFLKSGLDKFDRRSGE